MDLNQAIKDIVREAVREELAELRRALLAAHPITSDSAADRLQAPGKAVLTFRQVHDLYGVGRQEWNRLISSGQMEATQRRMRGGHSGYVVGVHEAARVLGGRPYKAA